MKTLALALLLAGSVSAQMVDYARQLKNAPTYDPRTYLKGSVTVGIQEAINAAYTAGGGTVLLPGGAISPTATIFLKPQVTIKGQGPQATRIVPASCSALVFGFANLPAQPAPTGFPVYAYSNIKLRDFMIDGHSCNGINTQTGVGLFAGIDTTTTSLATGIRIDGVYFNNVGQGVRLERARDVVLSHVRGYANTRFLFTDTTAGFNASNHSFEIHLEDFTARSGCFNTVDCSPVSMTAAVVQLDSCETCSVRRAYDEGQGQTIANIGIQVTGFSENTVLDHVTMNQYGKMIDIAPMTINGVSTYPGYGVISNCALDQAYTNSITFEDGALPNDFRQVHDYQIIGTQISNLHTGAGTGTDQVYVGLWSKNISIVGSNFSSILNGQVGLHIASFTSSITVSGNTFDAFLGLATTTGKGILIDAGASALAITGNTFDSITSFTAPIVDNSGFQLEKNISGNTPQSLIPQNGISVIHANITKIANGAQYQNGFSFFNCTTPAGCWTSVNHSVPLTPVTATTSQQVFVVSTYGSNIGAFVTNARLKTSTACTGTTTLTASLGAPSSSAFYVPAYDLKAAVSASNFAPVNGLLSSAGSSFAQDAVVVNFASTGGTLDQVAAGCSLDIWLFYTILPQ